jgi:hypothetical protein
MCWAVTGTSFFGPRVEQGLGGEGLYSAAAVVTSARDAVTTGAYNELGETTSLKNLVATFAAHIAGEAARA